MAWPALAARVVGIVLNVVRKMPKGAWPKVAEYLGKATNIGAAAARKMNPMALLQAVYKTAGSVWRMIGLLFKAMCACGYVYFAVEIFNMLRTLIPDEAVDILLDIFRDEGVDITKVDGDGNIIIDVTPGNSPVQVQSHAPAQVELARSSTPFADTMAEIASKPLAAANAVTETAIRVMPVPTAPVKSAREMNRSGSPAIREFAAKEEALRKAIPTVGSARAFMNLREALMMCDEKFLNDYMYLRGK